MARYDVFISYSRRDTEVADRICDAFDAEGITYFIDRSGIGGGQEFPTVLADAICDSALFLFLASENSYNSKFTNSEISFAFNEKPHETIIPYIIDDSDLPRHMRFIFASINWRNTREHPLDSVLVDDIFRLLGRGRQRKEAAPSMSGKVREITDEAKALCLKGKKCLKEECYEEALNLFFRSAKMGCVEAEFQLGNLYSKGGIPIFSYDKAVEWYGSAACHGHLEAMKHYAALCLRLDRDNAKYCYWYLKAAEAGDADAQRVVGGMYCDGKGMEYNPAEGVRWLKKAASQGNGGAQYRLSRMYHKGEPGVGQNKKASLELLEKAAKSGEAKAQYELGEMYVNGKDVPKDYTEALKWHTLAADQGLGMSQLIVGMMYMEGTAGLVDLHKAELYLKKASEAGLSKAKEALGSLRKKRFLANFRNLLKI